MIRTQKLGACLFLFVSISIGIAMLAPGPLVPAVEAAAATRCGWFVNPTPANAWLIDAAGQWIIAVQGGHQADGDWPEFSNSRWVETNGSHGYGCACMKVSTDRNRRVQRIYSAYSRPLSACRSDRAIRNREPNG